MALVTRKNAKGKSVAAAGFVATDEQEAIFEAVAKCGDNLIVEALAGTGKTTTQEHALGRARESRLGAVAFNKSIAVELGKRLEDAWTGTMHSRGYGMLAKKFGGRLQMKKYKYHNLLKENGFEGTRWMENQVVKLIGLVRDTCQGFVELDEDEQHEVIRRIVEKYELESPPNESIVAECLKDGVVLFEEEGIIDFSDMIWLPLALRLKFEKFGLLAVDESQDLNPSQIEFALKMGRRFLVVGDRHQSIYGFRGADTEAIDTLAKSLGAMELPLTMTMRCPTEIVKLANRLVPSLRARPDAPEGEVRVRGSVESARGGDLVLCRLNAPLIEALYALWRRSIPARIIGRDMVESLNSLVRKVLEKRKAAKSIKDFCLELERIISQELDTQEPRESFVDMAQTLLDIARPCESVGEVERMIREIFVDVCDDDTVRLSTVHRAKGLEAERVIVLRPDTIPCQYATQEWELEQERNLCYVAITRVKGDGQLIFTGDLPGMLR